MLVLREAVRTVDFVTAFVILWLSDDSTIVELQQRLMYRGSTMQYFDMWSTSLFIPPDIVYYLTTDRTRDICKERFMSREFPIMVLGSSRAIIEMDSTFRCR